MRNVKYYLTLLISVLGLGSLTAVLQAQDKLVISEFMAVNDATLADEDGNFPDWIEIYNADTSTVNLSGWSLTDTVGEPAKWRFPATNLPPNGLLLVFASNRDRRTPGKPLHANFKLSDTGEFLALVRPDGTIASQYSPAYPIQASGVSYGFPMTRTVVPLISAGAPAKVLVPANGDLALTWTTQGFDDATWTSVATGVGYEAVGPPAITPVTIADSVADWSSAGTQGANGWFYGSWNKKADADGIYDAATEFTPFPRATGNVLADTNYWNGTKWDLAGGSNAPPTEMSSATGHPSGDSANPTWPVEWAIRRYVCESNGPIRITGTLACNSTNATCGDGTIGRILVDGAQVFERAVFGASVGFSIVVPASIGSLIDFVIDAGPANNSQCDLTTFTAVIRTMGGAQVVADTIGDWSETGTQGHKNWFYGYHNVTADTVPGYQATNFIAFPSGTGPHSAANFWNGESWDWFDGDPPWTRIDQTVSYPSRIAGQTGDKADEHWVIRRWVSEVSGAITIDWHVGKKEPSGGGVTTRILQNGTQRDTFTLAGANFAGTSRTTVITNVQTGDLIDFTVEPGPDAVGDEVFVDAVIYGEPSLGNQITSNLESALRNVNATAYLRVPFAVADLAGLNSLTLRMKYNDGFVAYLNGVQVAARNAPVLPAWNSAATAAHANADAVQFEDFDLSGVRDLLQAGANVLAIHGLNASAGDADFLLLPELGATRPMIDTAVQNYFASPTPGSLNGLGNPKLGPLVLDVTHSPHEPAASEDLVVTARLAPTFNPVNAVRLYYRIMYTAETNLLMMDDGLHGDGRADDGVYGAKIPGAATKAGQMMRYYVTATDTRSNLTRLPPYPDPLNSAQYLGTVVLNPALTNRLPVLHWFSQNTNDIINGNPARGSWYFLGEFYDNMSSRIHGQSSSGFPKKSYNVDFNPDHHFRYDPNEARVDDINMLTTYPDKAHMRNMLGYETHRDAGPRSPYHWVVPIRVQLNANFHGDWDLVENGDDNYLQRLGRDPKGALYKMYDTMTDVGTAEKKTRRNEDKSDLTALIRGSQQSGTNLVRYLYDNVDLPETLNFLATMSLIGNVDCCHKNYYVYRDTEDTGLWEMFPWDVDLNFGRNWDGTLSYWDDRVHADNQLYVGGNATLPSALFNLQATKQMYLRRFRTLMDTLLQSSTVPLAERYHERRINELANLLAPDAALDLAKWGTWGDGVTANAGPIAKTSIYYKTLPQSVAELLTTYLPARRTFLFNMFDNNPNDEFPAAQPANTVILITGVEFNPSSGNQAEEYIQLQNTNRYAVDLSGWRLTGAVDYTFQGGTVMVTNSLMYVAANQTAFRRRATGPRGGQSLFIQGNYQGELSARGETIVLVDTAGRIVRTNAYAGNPSLAQQNLRLTEIMYHPPIAPPGSVFEAEDFEYLELKNIGLAGLDLTGVRFSSGIEFSFTGSAVTLLNPGASVLVVKNLAAFASRYGNGLPVAGQYVGLLDNSGENLRLDDAMGEKILDFAYDNKWYPITDGPGASLVIVDENAAWNTWGLKASWRPSAVDFGSPGQGDPAPAPTAVPVVVNEVLTHTVPPLADAIELYNPTATDANIGGWFISDDFSNPKKFRVPNGKIVPAGGYLVFNETDFNPPPGTPPSFSFSAKGDEAYIFSGDGTHLTGYLHGYQFGAAESGVPFGRYHTSTGAVHFVAMSSRTLSATNALPKVGPVVISEIMYHPVDLAGAVDNSQDEYVELHNFSNQDVPLFDPLARTNTWRLRGGVEFDFPTNVTLKASNYLVVVSFDVADAGLLAAFRGTYGLGADALIHGPYRGKLDNSHNSVALYRPDQAETGEAPYVLIDRVEYSDSPPWTIAADGFGPALQRLRMTEYGNDLINWTAVAPNPGGPSLAGLAPTIIAQPTNQTVVASQSASFSVSAEGTPPRRYQWLFNGGGLPGATGPNLTLNNVGADQTGGYSVIVFNTDGVAQSKTAMLTVLVPAAIIVQPQSQTVRAGTNVTLSVTATSSTTISYQWRRNGLNLPGANSSTLVLNNVSDANNGDYSVVLTDAVGPLTSAPATLWVVYVPVILQQPQNMTAVVGDNVTFTVQVTGTTPMGFRWRRESSTFVAQGQAALTIPNVQLNNAGKFSVVITNAANLSVTSSNAVLTVLTDTDGDHIPDDWETANGFDPNDSRDGALDSDGDTMTNWQEYVAGTDPHDPESYLKVNRLAVGNSATIEFTAVSNKTYSIEYKDSLGRLSWSKLTDVTVQATNRTAVVTDPNAGSSRYYRLITPLRP